MQITVIGRNLDVGDALRSHAATAVTAAMQKYFHRPVDATVTIGRDAHMYRAHISANAGRGLLLQSTAEAGGPYPAIDQALAKLEKQLRRHKRRVTDHHQHTVAAPPVEENETVRQYVLEAGTDDHHSEAEVADGQPLVVADMEMTIETLTVGEAVMRLDLADLPALLFRNRSHGGLNMLYRRHDGHVGWVDAGPAKG